MKKKKLRTGRGRRKRFIDLQCHTTASDGKLEPEELVELAAKKGLDAIAITDHDSVDGIKRAVAAGKRHDVEIVKGVEITCDDRGFVDTHILGLFIDENNQALNVLLRKAKKYRENQKKSIVNKLQKLGLNINFNRVRELAKGEIGRPHIAKALMEANSGKFSSIDEIFDRYLGVGKPAYVERKNKIGLKEAIEAIHKSHGLAFISHPGVYTNFDAGRFIDYFLQSGGDGIETYYDYGKSRHKTDMKKSARIVSRYKKLAKKLGILQTGGSDFHGRLGKFKVPYKVLENLKLVRKGK